MSTEETKEPGTPEDRKPEIPSAASVKEDKKPEVPLKSSMEILSELFSTFDAEPPVIVKKEKSEQKKHKKSKKKHKHKKEKKRKREDSRSSEENAVTKVLIKHELNSPKRVKLEQEDDVKVKEEPKIKKEGEKRKGGNKKDESRTKSSKIVIKDLKFSSIFEATIREIKEKQDRDEHLEKSSEDEKKCRHKKKHKRHKSKESESKSTEKQKHSKSKEKRSSGHRSRSRSVNRKRHQEEHAGRYSAERYQCRSRSRERVKEHRRETSSHRGYDKDRETSKHKQHERDKEIGECKEDKVKETSKHKDKERSKHKEERDKESSKQTDKDTAKHRDHDRGKESHTYKDDRNREESKSKDNNRDKEATKHKDRDRETSKHKNKHRETSKHRDDKDRETSKSKDHKKDRETSKHKEHERDKAPSKHKDHDKDKDKTKSRRDSRERTRNSERDNRHSSKEKRRSRDRDRYRYDRSDSKDSSYQINKKKLLEIARRNAIQMMKSGSLPGALTLGPQAQEKVINAIKAGGKTIEELTEFCKSLSKKEELGELSSISGEGSDSDNEKAFHHPFQIKDRPTSITVNIKNSVPLPTKTTQERSAELRMQFPVSSGQQHRKTEVEWVPVPTKKTDTKAAVPVNCNSQVTSIEDKVAINPVDASPGTQVFPTKTTEEKIDIGSIVSQRLSAIRRLQENPNDSQAISQMNKVQKEMQSWTESKQQPGQFTGSTGAQIMTPAELAPGFQAWARKDQLQTAAPVSGGMGMHLLQKMGWKPGEGLGKEKRGTLEPLLLEVKLDKKGLVATEEQKKKQGKQKQKVATAAPMVQGKHPVSLLGEYASKCKIGPPQYDLCLECGPDHKKNFLFKVTLNGIEYKPNVASPNKKEAKAHAATLCLQQLGLLPPPTSS